MCRYSLICFLFLSSIFLFAQIPDGYSLLIRRGDSLAAFDLMGNKGLINDRYRAARAWDMAEMPDSSFHIKG